MTATPSSVVCVEPREARRSLREKQPDEAARETDAAQRRDQAEHQAFREQLPHQPSLSGAERAADGHFANRGAAPRARSRFETLPQAISRTKPTAPSRTRRRSRESPTTSVHERGREEFAVRVVLRKPLAEAGGDRRELLVRLLHRHPVAQSSVDAQIMFLVRRFAFRRERDR